MKLNFNGEFYVTEDHWIPPYEMSERPPNYHSLECCCPLCTKTGPFPYTKMTIRKEVSKEQLDIMIASELNDSMQGDGI